MFTKKRVTLCVTGGIACYKSVNLASLLVKNNFLVDVVLTENAKKFVSPLSFSAITGNKVYSDEDFFDPTEDILHIKLANNDAVIVAPATMNTIAKINHGIADNLVTNLVLATKSKVFIVPAMNTNMYYNDATQNNINDLKSKNYNIIEPIEGLLACKTVGKGKMQEPEVILKYFLDSITDNSCLANKKVLLTGGPTVSKLDPTRIFTNRSSGKMANALGEVLKNKNAAVDYISYFKPTFNADNYYYIDTTESMLEEISKRINEYDILIMNAAPLDYEFETYYPDKIKKDDSLTFSLKRTPDILSTIKDINKNTIIFGFAAESTNHFENGKNKLKRKGMNLIFVNDIKSSENGMGSSHNSGFLITDKGDSTFIEPDLKINIARVLIDKLEEYLVDSGYFC